MFTKAHYEALHQLVFRPDYPGYKPTVQEIPNGDGNVDAAKRYAHVAPKYFATTAQRAALAPYLDLAHAAAIRAALAVGIPDAYMPDIRYGALRVLEYPPGAVSHEHEDFDLFTLMCYRDQPDRFVAHDDAAPGRELPGLPLTRLRRFNKQAHLGQIGATIGLGDATRHSVLASETAQHSIVYFAIPDWAAVLPGGATVKDWLNERMARSRTEFKKYE